MVNKPITRGVHKGVFFRSISQIMGATTFLGVFMTKKHKSEKKLTFREKPRFAGIFSARISDLPVIFINET